MNKKQQVEVIDKPKKSKEISAYKENLSIENLLITAVKQGTPVETMERLLAMRKDLKQEQAKEAFGKAMAKFQSECPIIKKKKAGGKTKQGTIAYYYAPLDSIISQVRGLLTSNGFSYSIQTKTNKDSVKAICTAKHELGHSESSDMTVPLSGTNIMSAPQITAAALTFAKRYAFCNAFGIMTGDDDIDDMQNKAIATQKTSKTDIEKMIKDAINEATSSDEVMDLDKKTQLSQKFSKKFKDEIKKLANKKVDELNK
jgi:hypothetical protein